jgi:hypothetical protein
VIAVISPAISLLPEMLREGGNAMRVSDVDFIKNTAEYLDQLNREPILITRDDREYAILSKPTETPITDSLAGILKGADIAKLEDIKKMRLGG